MTTANAAVDKAAVKTGVEKASREAGGEAAGFGPRSGISAAGATGGDGTGGTHPSAKCAEGWGNRLFDGCGREFSAPSSQFSGTRLAAFFW